MKKTPTETLAERLARMPPRTPEEQAWLDIPPAGWEILPTDEGAPNDG